MATQQGGAEIAENDIAPTLTAAAGMSGNNQPVVCYTQGSYGEYKEGIGTLRASGGDFGGE